jgi:hypothetical protein
MYGGKQIAFARWDVGPSWLMFSQYEIQYNCVYEQSVSVQTGAVEFVINDLRVLVTLPAA